MLLLLFQSGLTRVAWPPNLDEVSSAPQDNETTFSKYVSKSYFNFIFSTSIFFCSSVGVMVSPILQAQVKVQISSISVTFKT